MNMMIAPETKPDVAYVPIIEWIKNNNNQFNVRVNENAFNKESIATHGNHLGWNEDRKSRAECGSTVFMFSAFNLFVLGNKRCPKGVITHCSEPAVFHLLQNLLSLLMRLIKPVQSLFNEAPAARSKERATAAKTGQSRPWGAKLWNGFLKKEGLKAKPKW